jgi:TolB-like protein
MALLASAPAWAQSDHLVAVLPVKQAPDTGLTTAELNDLTDLARLTAADVLRGHSIVMTEQNMQRILKGMGLTLEQCQAETGDCAVEIARKLQADHVVTGKVRRAFGKLTLNVELYETARGALLVAKRVSVKTKEEFEEKIRPAMASALMALPGMGSSGGLHMPLQERRDTQGANWRSTGSSLAVVKFQSTPPGATILVDNKVVCQGKPRCSKALTPGLHKVQMLLERHVTREEMVDTATTAQIDWQLKEDFARLSVDTDPPGVEIVIDGTEMGPGPHDDLELSVGAHVVKAGGDRCFKEHRKELRLHRGDMKKHTLEPVRRLAGLWVNATDDEGNDLVVEVRSGDMVLGRSFEALTIGLCDKNLNILTEDERTFPLLVSLAENKKTTAPVVVPRELSRSEKRERERSQQARRMDRKRDEKVREDARAQGYQRKVVQFHEEQASHGATVGISGLAAVCLALGSLAPFIAASEANDEMNIYLSDLQDAEDLASATEFREDAIAVEEERNTHTIVGWSMVGLAGVATLVAIIAYNTMPDSPTHASRTDDELPSSWSAGPASTGEGFQVEWSARW